MVTGGFDSPRYFFHYEREAHSKIVGNGLSAVLEHQAAEKAHFIHSPQGQDHCRWAESLQDPSEGKGKGVYV